MKEQNACNGCPETNNQQALQFLNEQFAATIHECPGCLYNCYMIEESLGQGPLPLRLLFAILELPTLYQMAKVIANREKSGWGTGRVDP